MKTAIVALALLLGPSACVTNTTPWPIVPEPPQPTSVAQDDLYVPPPELRYVYESQLRERIHALDMRLYFSQALTAQSRMAASCKVEEDQALSVVSQKRRELGAALFTLESAEGRRWIGARGKAEALYREYDEGVDRLTGVGSGLADAPHRASTACAISK